MIFFTAIIAFLAVLAMAVGLYLAFAPSTDFLQVRLAQLWRPIVPVSRTGPLSEKH